MDGRGPYRMVTASTAGPAAEPTGETSLPFVASLGAKPAALLGVAPSSLASASGRVPQVLEDSAWVGHRLNRHDMMLAAMSGSGCAPFQPVHVQKLFFLIDEKLGAALGGKYFDFEPYDYGPFDKVVYAELDAMCAEGLVAIKGSGSYREYTLTEADVERGRTTVAKLSGNLPQSLSTLARFVRSLGFAELVSAVYRAYPAMKVNSVFSER